MRMDLNRRTMLRGMVNGTAVAIGLPLLDLFLDTNGEVLAATGAPVPVRFGTWFWGLGVNPPRFFPDGAGPLGALKIEAEPMTPYKSKINILGNFIVMLDGAPNRPHGSGGPSIRQGRAPSTDDRGGGASFDVTIAETIGTTTRFRSLDVSPSGGARNSLSSSGNGNVNPSESTPQGLYMRIFGDGFRDPNSATFVPDPEVVARRSVLSGVMDPIKSMESQLGAADKQRLDQYFTSLRQLENQLDVQLTKPSPMQGCVVPTKVGELKVSNEIETVVVNHQLMADLLVMALACDNTRVFNMNFNQGSSNLTRAGSTITHHQLTHEETLDQKLGYQPNATYFVNKIMEGWAYFVKALDSVKEGDRTLLDNTLVFAHSETEFAKFHTIDNIPMMTAGSAGGRIKTGRYVDGGATPVSRVGLTLQQVMGVSVDRWGAKSMETNKAIGEMIV